ncbi:hypothetical protein V1279_000861 [Bradyrhizobium sp. AZCC 1610]
MTLQQGISYGLRERITGIFGCTGSPLPSRTTCWLRPTPPRSVAAKRAHYAKSDIGVNFRHGVLLGFGAPHELLLLVGREHGRTIPLTDVWPILHESCSKVHAAPLDARICRLSLRGRNMKRCEFITLLGGSGRYWPNSAPSGLIENGIGLVCESKNPPQLFFVVDFEVRFALISICPEPSPSG